MTCTACTAAPAGTTATQLQTKRAALNLGVKPKRWRLRPFQVEHNLAYGRLACSAAQPHEMPSCKFLGHSGFDAAGLVQFPVP